MWWILWSPLLQTLHCPEDKLFLDANEKINMNSSFVVKGGKTLWYLDPLLPWEQGREIYSKWPDIQFWLNTSRTLHNTVYNTNTLNITVYNTNTLNITVYNINPLHNTVYNINTQLDTFKYRFHKHQSYIFEIHLTPDVNTFVNGMLKVIYCIAILFYLKIEFHKMVQINRNLNKNKQNTNWYTIWLTDSMLLGLIYNYCCR